MAAPERLIQALAHRYRIERELGQGGMATVYLAEDLKHKRHVALKVLKPELAAVLGAERFVQEITTTASLSHPHILPLFDSGEADGFLFYVMPFVEGETLRDRLNRETQLGVDEAVRITREIADALHYAHSRGVIHRDIKPENILLQGGRPLVADFGIALAVSAAAGGRMTETGLSLGTPHYMSPEQATAEKEITGRSDVYSLASVCFEMLAGQPPHLGGSAQQIIMKIIAEPVEPVTRYRKTVPPNVEAALSQALEKLPADRFESAEAFAQALGNTAFASTALSSAGMHGAARSQTLAWRAWLSQPLTLALAVVALLGLAGTARYALLGIEEAPHEAVRFTLTFDGNHQLVDAVGSPFALSPDGRLVAYSGVTGSNPRRIFLRPIGELNARELAGTDGATNPIFSPDGEWIAFEAAGQLKKIPVSGGTALPLADVPGFMSVSWATPDQIIVGLGGRLAVVPASGGSPRVFAVPDSGIASMRWPLALPDGKSVLFTAVSRGVQGPGARIGVASIVDGTYRVFDLSGSSPQAVIDGRLIYAGAGSLMAVPFDVAALEPSGAPVSVIDRVRIGVIGVFKGSVSASGSLVYQAGDETDGSTLLLAGPRSRGTPVLPERRAIAAPRYSPDGRHIAMAIQGDRRDIWIYDLPTGPLRRLTTDGALNDRPEWTPDSRNVVFRSYRGGPASFWIQPADGNSGAKPFLSIRNSSLDELMFSSDGQYMILQVDTSSCNCVGKSYYRRVSGDTSLVSISGDTPGQHTTPRISYDGRWVAYRSNETGRYEVYVKPFPALDRRYQISLAGGEQPVWSRDGRRLYYLDGSVIMAASLTFSPDLVVTARDTVMEDVSRDPLPPTSLNHANFDVAPDGRSLLFLQGATTMGLSVVVVHDWKYELRQRLGGTPRD